LFQFGADRPIFFESLEQTRRLLLNQQIELAKQLREIEKLMPRKRISEKLIKTYHNFMNNRFIPYLKQEGITKIEDVKPQKP